MYFHFHFFTVKFTHNFCCFHPFFFAFLSCFSHFHSFIHKFHHSFSVSFVLLLLFFFSFALASSSFDLKHVFFSFFLYMTIFFFIIGLFPPAHHFSPSPHHRQSLPLGVFFLNAHIFPSSNPSATLFCESFSSSASSPSLFTFPPASFPCGLYSSATFTPLSFHYPLFFPMISLTPHFSSLFNLPIVQFSVGSFLQCLLFFPSFSPSFSPLLGGVFFLRPFFFPTYPAASFPFFFLM